MRTKKKSKTRSTKKEKGEKSVTYVVYSDGSALGNPGPGGYAAIVRCGDQEVTLSKGYFQTTNNRQEIMAVIAALEEFGPNKHFEIYSDSMYVIDGATKWVKSWARNNWTSWQSGQPVKNKDLWVILKELLDKNKVKFFKVKAHSGDEYNEKADKLAKAAAASPTAVDVFYVNPT